MLYNSCDCPPVRYDMFEYTQAVAYTDTSDLNQTSATDAGTSTASTRLYAMHSMHWSASTYAVRLYMSIILLDSTTVLIIHCWLPLVMHHTNVQTTSR